MVGRTRDQPIEFSTPLVGASIIMLCEKLLVISQPYNPLVELNKTDQHSILLNGEELHEVK